MVSIDLALYSLIAMPESRRLGARKIAELLEASDLFIFDFDPEIGKYLPSSGFPQTIPGGRVWQEFLRKCSVEGSASARLPLPGTGHSSEVAGKSFANECIFVFLNGNLSLLEESKDLPLVAMSLLRVLQAERESKKHESQRMTYAELTHDLRSYAEALDRAKQELRRALKEAEIAKNIAEEANQTKSAFLANMSHEIRTPLSAILGFSGLLKEPGLSTEDKDQFIETILRSGQSLTRIIDDILDLSKVEAGKLELEETNFSLIDLVQESVDLFKVKVQQRKIFLLMNVEESVPQFIHSDPARLRQILINLIGNAVKFTDTGGVRVNVHAKLEDEGALKICFDIKDTGCGLSEQQALRLFQPFMQADNTSTRKFGGTGLGLALSKRLAEALGGSVWLRECSLGKGCTFSAEIVATVAKEIKSGKALRPGTSARALKLEGLKILLVDDSIDNLYLAKRILHKNGALVDTAEDGQQAANRAAEKKYSAILLDIQMPIMDGYQALSAIRKFNQTVPIIALTAHAMNEERTKTRHAGFISHLTKPLNAPELIETILAAVQPPV